MLFALPEPWPVATSVLQCTESTQACSCASVPIVFNFIMY
uniref:Uncharacterized protein n=1 Tax=Arundo donax TaxID=35708 RepID=A0A0A8YRB2_ARUDO